MTISNSKRWWQCKKANAHEAIFSTLDRLRSSIEEREYQYKRWLSLYEGREVHGLRASDAGSVFANPFMDTKFHGLTLNVVQSCTDTLASMICSQEPRPMFLTERGEWELKQQAKQLEQFVSGVFYDVQIYEQAKECFLDAAIFGTGFLKVCELDGEILCERVFPLEVIVDEKAALTTDPRSMFQYKELSAEVLSALYPDKETKISQAATLEYSDQDGGVVTTDLIKTIEGWHLPSSKNSKDGRHIIAIDNCTLLDEPWTLGYFPIIPLRWNKRRLRYFGQGLSEQLEGIQLEINKLLRRIQDAMHLYSVANTYVEEGSLVSKQQLKNTSGNIIEYRKGHSPPHTVMPAAMSNDVFDHLWRLRESAYEIAGVSALSATSKKPAGIESGIAIQTVLDVETRRFALLSKDWEKFFCTAATQVIDVARELYKHQIEVKASYRAKDFIETIDWSEIDLDRDQYVLQVWPVSLLPKSPAGRLDAVDKMIQRGMLDARQGLDLLDFPDVEKFRSLEIAAIDDIDRSIHAMIVDGDYKSVAPTEFQDLELGVRKVMSALLRARVDGIPEDRLELLERWLSDAAEIMNPIPIEKPSFTQRGDLAEAFLPLAPISQTPGPTAMAPGEPPIEQQAPM